MPEGRRAAGVIRSPGSAAPAGGRPRPCPPKFRRPDPTRPTRPQLTAHSSQLTECTSMPLVAADRQSRNRAPGHVRSSDITNSGVAPAASHGVKVGSLRSSHAAASRSAAYARRMQRRHDQPPALVACSDLAASPSIRRDAHCLAEGLATADLFVGGESRSEMLGGHVNVEAIQHQITPRSAAVASVDVGLPSTEDGSHGQVWQAHCIPVCCRRHLLSR
jgi:hypothetical protein